MKIMSRRWISDICSVLILAGLIVVYFFRLFFPTQQLIVTPDFGHSDAWHLSFAGRFFLSEQLHKGILPLWSKNVGSGFPILGEGQTSILFPPNILLLGLFDPVTGYTLSLVLSFLLFGWGMYAWLRSLLLSPLSALFGSSAVTFSGITIGHLTHAALLQSLSFMPMILAATQFILKRPTLPRIGLLSILLGLQLLAGFPQAALITLVCAELFVLWHAVYTRPIPWFSLIAFTTAVILGIAIAAVQLLPSNEFLQQTSTPKGFLQEAATQFSFPFNHLLTFFHPYALGNPKEGTYPPFFTTGSIFWENSGFIGIIPMLALLSLAWTRRHMKKNQKRTLFFFAGMLLFSLLLMLGAHSPLYLVFSFWPLNLFRVPSRFIWIFVFSAVTLSAMAIDQFLTRPSRLRRALVIMLIGVNIAHLYSVWFSYHALDPATLWTTQPELVKTLSFEDTILTLGDKDLHNATFLKDGWKNIAPYRFLRNTLSPNSNSIWGIRQIDVFSGRPLYRSGIVNSLLMQEIAVGEHEATVSAFGQKLLNQYGVTTLVSAVPIMGDTSLQQTNMITTGGQSLFLYNNPGALPRVYIASQTTQAITVQQARSVLMSDPFIPGTSVLTEKQIFLPPQKSTAHTVVETYTDMRLRIRVIDNTTDALVVIQNTFYPGWKAMIDDAPTTIYAANINEQAVRVPAGDHLVELTFQPQSFLRGAWISGISSIIALGLVAAPVFAVFLGIFGATRRLF